jgi:hypothetical protein
MVALIAMLFLRLFLFKQTVVQRSILRHDSFSLILTQIGISSEIDKNSNFISWPYLYAPSHNINHNKSKSLILTQIGISSEILLEGFLGHG